MVQAAIKYQFGQVSVLQSFIPYTRQLLKGNPSIHVVGNVSFPSGSDSTSLKVVQAKEMIAAGCDEIDMVMNIPALKNGENALFMRDIEGVVASAAAYGCIVKVITENCLLTDDEKRRACDWIADAGAAFVKTSTAYAEGGATLEDVRLMSATVGSRCRVKAAGGIRTIADVLAFLNAGLHIVIHDERTQKSHDFQFDGGIISFVEYLNRSKQSLHEKPMRRVPAAMRTASRG